MAAFPAPYHFAISTVTYLVNSAWQVPLVLAAALAAARLLARLGPRAVHRLWVGALLAAVALPACRLSDWSLPLVRLWQGAAAGAGDVRVTVLAAGSSAGSALQWAPWLLELLFAAYAASILCGCVRLLVALRRVRRTRRSAVVCRTAGPLRESWTALRVRMESPDVQLAESAGISGPMVLGVRHPLLLVPTGFFARVSGAERDAALAHELAHVRRRDFAKNLAYSVLALPAAWHPCLWLVRARVGESREMVCDTMAAEATGGSRAYARSLLRLAESLPTALRGRVLPAMGIFDGNTLERRVTNMMDKRKKLRGAARWAALGVVGLLTAGAGASTLGMHMDVMAASAAAGQAHKPLHVKSGVMAGNILSRVTPIYPPEAKKKHEQGRVTLGATINKQGEISNLRVVKSAGEALDQSAVTAVKQWRYKPYLLNGEPVEVQTRINVTYTLGK